MKTKLATITPEWAADKLRTTNNRNRPLSERYAERLAQDIKNGHWIPTHQGIAFSENGNLLDGQHRLRAVQLAGLPVQMLVTTGISTNQQNGILIDTFDVIDGGKMRSVGQRLSLDGMPNGNQYAAACSVIARIASGFTSISLTAPQTRHILAIYGSEIGEMLASSRTMQDRQSAIIGTFAFAIKSDATITREFADRFFSMENLSRNHPALALRRWLANHGVRGGSERLRVSKVIASGLLALKEGRGMSKIYSNEDAMAWLLSGQKSNVRKVCEVIGV